MADLKPASDEQRAIIDAFATNNVIVNATAGSGKTTTCLHIARQFPNDRVLLLTYNRRLMDDTTERVKKHDLRNLHAYTYHAFANRHYGSGADDTKMAAVVADDRPPRCAIHFSRILIDEAQDIRPLLYRFIRKVMRENQCAAPYIGVLGDDRQMIYEYMGADERFLLMAADIYPSPWPWLHRPLNVSYRMTSAMVDFINHCMMPERPIVAAAQFDLKPEYMICDIFNPDYAFACIRDYIAAGARPDEIMVIAPTIRAKKSHHGPPKTPLGLLERKITLANIRANNNGGCEWPVTSNYDCSFKISDKVAKGKILLSSIHGVKGCERPFVIVYGFDAGFYRELPPMTDDETKSDKCPNLLYVAASRATTHVTFIHSMRCGYLPFLNVGALDTYANVRRPYEILPRGQSRRPNDACETVTGLTAFIGPEAIRRCMQLLRVTTLRPAGAPISIAGETKQRLGYEQVAAITGKAIPLYYQFMVRQRQGRLSGNDLSLIMGLRDDHYLRAFEAEIKEVHDNPQLLIDIGRLLRMCVLATAREHGMLYVAHQIRECNWISPGQRDACTGHLQSLGLHDDTRYECDMRAGADQLHESPPNPNSSPVGLRGFADCIDPAGRVLYEFKCTAELRDEHVIQLALYALLWHVTNCAMTPPLAPMRFMLYNILTNELRELDASLDELKVVYHILREHTNDTRPSDAEFIARCMASSADDEYDEAVRARHEAEGDDE